jgi:hypothetical protein
VSSRSIHLSVYLFVVEKRGVCIDVARVKCFQSMVVIKSQLQSESVTVGVAEAEVLVSR